MSAGHLPLEKDIYGCILYYYNSILGKLTVAIKNPFTFQDDVERCHERVNSPKFYMLKFYSSLLLSSLWKVKKPVCIFIFGKHSDFKLISTVEKYGFKFIVSFWKVQETCECFRDLKGNNVSRKNIVKHHKHHNPAGSF